MSPILTALLRTDNDTVASKFILLASSKKELKLWGTGGNVLKEFSCRDIINYTYTTLIDNGRTCTNVFATIIDKCIRIVDVVDLEETRNVIDECQEVRSPDPLEMAFASFDSESFFTSTCKWWNFVTASQKYELAISSNQYLSS
jgi:hypothetical protein